MNDNPSSEMILVTCRANVARSPLASALLREALTRSGRRDIDVESAGLEAIPGHPAAPEVVHLSESLSLDLSGHVARQLTTSLLGEASLVLTMTEGDRARTTRLLPGVVPRTFTVLELDRLLARAPRCATPSDLAGWAHRQRPHMLPAEHREDIEDPVGQPLKQFQRVSDRLAGLMERVAARLEQ